MRNRFVILLALSASLVLNVGLSAQQTIQAAQASTTDEEQKSSLQIASLSPGPMPTLLSPLHSATIPATSRPQQMNLPGAKDDSKKKPAVVLPVPGDSGTEKAPKPLTPTKKSTPAAGKTTSTKSNAKTKKAKKKSKAFRIVTACSMKSDDDEKVKYVALTFDDGPSPVYTPQVLSILKKEGIHATFCVIGRQAKKYPGLVQQIVADGHKIADHSMNHDEHLDNKSDEKIKAEILGTKSLIQSIVPGTPVEYYRAPGGNCNRRLRELVTSWGIKPLGWSVDTKDWQKPGVDSILATVKTELRPGGIILMHDAGGNRSDTIKALEKVIPLLRKEGYQFIFPG